MSARKQKTQPLTDTEILRRMERLLIRREREAQDAQRIHADETPLSSFYGGLILAYGNLLLNLETFRRYGLGRNQGRMSR